LGRQNIPEQRRKSLAQQADWGRRIGPDLAFAAVQERASVYRNLTPA